MAAGHETGIVSCQSRWNGLDKAKLQRGIIRSRSRGGVVVLETDEAITITANKRAQALPRV